MRFIEYYRTLHSNRFEGRWLSDTGRQDLGRE
jgi:hypothetical protein